MLFWVILLETNKNYKLPIQKNVHVPLSSTFYTVSEGFQSSKPIHTTSKPEDNKSKIKELYPKVQITL